MESVRLQAGEETPAVKSHVTQQAMSALQNADARTRAEARMAVQNLLLTLKNVEDKKRNVEETMALLVRETRAARRRKRQRVASGTGFIVLLAGLIYATRGKIFEHFWWILQLGGGAWAADKAASTRRDAAYTLSKAGDP